MPTQNYEEISEVMPSSPPYIVRDESQHAIEAPESPEENEDTNRRQPRTMKYKMVDTSVSEFSANDISRSSSFRPGKQVAVSGSLSNFGPSVLQLVDAAGRTVSGQSDIRNEELSPIYISRHNTVDGKIDYAALDLSAGELQQQLENLQARNEHQFGSDNTSDVSQILPGNLTVDTEDYAHNGRFVNLRRGGHSDEESFQKRMLSPSSLPAIDESAMLPEESMQASTPKQLPNIRKTRASIEYKDSRLPQNLPHAPQTPHPSPSKPHGKSQKNSNSASPLKLFGTYDTFTNQKLLRRLSQFEENFDGSSGGVPSTSAQEVTRFGLNDAFVAQSSPEKVSIGDSEQRQLSRKVTSFGQGDLDAFQFSEEISYESNRSNADDEDKENRSLPVLNPTTQTKFKFQLEPSPALEEDAITQRRTKMTSTTSTAKHIVSIRKTTRPSTGSSEDSPELPSFQRVEDLATPRKKQAGTEGKRLQKSPIKSPTPKRRRTLPKTDIAYTTTTEDVDSDLARDTHLQMQSAISKKRKDARHDDDQQAANPKVLAMRQILRPRTPTPSQRSSQQRDHAPLQELELDFTERAKLLQDQRIAKIQAELDSTDPPRHPALATSQQMLDESRKGSVTTQDFLDEAKKIMAGIRGKARPRSGLASLEESESSENDRNVSEGASTKEDELDESYQESTKEPFSRPPSREGAPVPRLPNVQQDPAILDHLRKYEEMSDMDGLIASSMKSIAMARSVANSAKEIDRRTDETISRGSGRQFSQDHVLESDPPNIRISENPDFQRKRKHSTSSIPTNSEEQPDFPSQGSNPSSGASSSRSIPTGSSRGSDSRRVIAPHTVSHLIPEQLAGMIFDRDRNIWIKRKTVSGESGVMNFLPSDETDDDPFGDIPDLSVDETQELQRVKAVAARRREEAVSAEALEAIQEDSPLSATILDLHAESEPSSEHQKLPKPTLRGIAGNAKISAEINPVPAMSSQIFTHNSQAVHHSQKSTRTEVIEEVVEEVEREISILEDRVEPQSTRHRRNVTIAFSSPLASIIQPSPYEGEDSAEYEAEQASDLDNGDDEEPGNGSIVINKRGGNDKTNSTRLRGSLRGTSRHISVSGHRFAARPVSRIDEQDENSLVENHDDLRNRSFSILVTTPAPSRRASSMVLTTPRPSHEVGTLDLTPLSDFTMNHANESFGMNVSYVAGNQRYVAGNSTKATLSLTIKDLVEKLTEVEPYEPFWGHIKQMDLRDKKLISLHKLDEFCEQIEELDVSRNQISQLGGAPSSIRHLRITHNYLSDLTAWGHLSNLQYIDISDNEIESLSAFKNLIHLRGLRADNNKIRSLDGIGHLDGLLSLRLRGNLVESLDFKGSRLQRLLDLDIGDNRISEVNNLHELRSLSILNLEGNVLCEFASNGLEELWALKYLKLSRNNLVSVDVSQCLNLRLLYLDRNRLGTVRGLLKTKHLDSLSMREQQEGAIIDMSFLSEAYEVRKLFLSGNLLGTFEPTVDFLNLQYLELANCGLESLPMEFGQMVANTRVLNLNLNALRDIKPLLGIIRLKKLHLAGNRLSRLRKTTNVLAQFPTMTAVDLRGNPLTIGFYPPVTEVHMVLRGGVEEDQAEVPDPFTWGKASAEMDDKYASRLDMDTRMLRRLYEMMALSGCKRLKTLDGLNVNRSIIGLKDDVWKVLIGTGMVNEGPPVENGTPEDGARGEKQTETENKASEGEKPAIEERWYAEDSFA
jgi:Leucine-rich repeat (LRR) protein